MSQLESDIAKLSEAILGERLTESSDVEHTLRQLKEGKGPFSMTLVWDETGERQSLVLHEWTDGNILLFDPTHTMESEAEHKETGMVTITEKTLRGWFAERKALALIPD